MNAKLWFKTFLAALFIMISAAATDSFAATYRSAQTGNWGTLSTWESWNGAAWVAAAAYPTAGDEATILTGHTVTLNLTITVTTLTINANGTLQTSYPLTVSGVLTVDENGILTTSAALTSSTTFALNGIANLGGNAAIADFNIGANAVLKPDAGIRTITLSGTLAVTTTANSEQVEYRNSSSGTGRLNWTLSGSGEDITNGLAAGTNLKFNNLNITGSYATVDASFYVYGNFTVNSGNFTAETPSTVYFDNADNGGTKTITNTSGQMNFWNFDVRTDAAVTANSPNFDIKILKDLTVQSSGLLTVETTTNIYMKATAAATITSNGTIQLNSSGLNRGTIFIDNSVSGLYVTLATNLANVDGALTVSANGFFNISSYTIGGSGNFTLSAGATLKLNNSDGVAGAILVTNARTFASTANYIFMGGKTGFTNAARASGANSSISTVNDFIVGTTTDAGVSVTSTESFGVSRSFSVRDASSGNNSFVASSGTVTFASAPAFITNENSTETLTFKDLVISNVSSTVSIQSGNTNGMNITGSLYLLSNGTTFIHNNTINFIGTGNFYKAATHTLTYGSGIINVGTSSTAANVTMLFALDIGATGTIKMDNASTIFNLQSYSFSATSASTASFTFINGTLKFSQVSGLAACFPGAWGISLAQEVSLEYDGLPTTFGLQFGAGITGTGTTTPSVTKITNLTVNSTAVAGLTNMSASSGSITLLGNFDVNGTSLINLAVGAGNANAVIMVGGSSEVLAKTIDVASGATLSLSSLTITSAAGDGWVTSTSNFTIKNQLATSAGDDYFKATAGMVTLTNATGAALTTPIATGGGVANIIFNDVTFAPVNDLHGFFPNADGEMTVNGSFYFTGGASSSFSATGGTVLMSNGVSASAAEVISKSNAGSLLTFYNLEITGNVKTATGSSSSTIGIASTAAGALTVNASSALFYTAGQIPVFAFNANAAGAIVNNGDSLVFYSVAVLGALSAETDGFYVDKNMVLSAAYTATGGVITFRGAPSTLTTTLAAITPAGITVPAGATLNLVTGGLDIITSANLDMIIQGTLDMKDVVTATGVGVGDVEFQDGSTLITATTTGVVGTFVPATLANILYGSGVNYQLDDGVNTAGFVAAATGGTGVTATNIVIMNNVTLSNCSFSFTAATAGDITINGNLSKTGANNAGPATGGSITMGGANSVISNAGGGRLGIWELVIDGTNVTTASSFEINTTADGTALTVNSGKKLTATSGTITINGAAPGTPAIYNNPANTITNLNFYNLEIGNTHGNGACVSPATTSSFIVGGLIAVHNAAGQFAATAGTIRMTGSSGTISNAGNTQSDLTFYDLDVTGTVVGFDNASGFTISNNLSVSGSLDVNGSAAIDQTLFKGAADQSHYITGSGDITFYGLQSDAGDPIYTNTDITIDGNLAGALDCSGAAGGFVAYEPSTVTLAKTTASANNFLTQSGDNVIFNNLTITGTDVDNNAPFKVKGDLTVASNAVFTNAVGSIITIDSTASKEIINDGTLTFYDLLIDNTIASSGNSAVTTASPFSFAAGGKITVAADGAFEATAGIITFNGGGATEINNNATAGATGLKFYSLQITAASQFVNGKDFYINGNLTADANFLNAAGAGLGTSKIYFGGSTEQLITVNGAAVVSLDDAEVNNSGGVKITGSPSIGVDDLAVYKTLRLQTGDLDLNGNNILTIKYNSGNGKLEETPGNTVINSGAETSTGHVYITNAFGALITNENFGGLGAQITTDINPGTLTVKRFHIPVRIGSASGPETISRYYSITSSVGTGLNALLVFKYDDSELGDIDESNLSLLSTSTDPVGSDEIWRSWSGASHDATNNLLILSGLDNFTAATERQYWTAAAATKVTITTLTKGVHEGSSTDGKLTAGRDKVAIFGLKAISDGEISMTSLTFTFLGANEATRTLAAGDAEFLRYALLSSVDDDLSTTSDNDTLVSNLGAANTKVLGGGVSSSYVGFDLSAAADIQTFTEGNSYHYFLVVRVNSTSNITTLLDTLQISVTHDDLTLSGGIVNAAELSGTKYTFQPGLTVAYISDGLADSPLKAGSTTQGVMGFSILGTNTATLRSFIVGFAPDITNKISNLKVYRSTDRSLTTTSDNTLVTTEVTWDGNEALVTFGTVLVPADENITTTAKYYFITGDIDGQVNKATTGLQASMNHDDLTSVTGGARYSTAITGKNYSFDIASLTVSIANTPAAKNLGRGVINQPIFGFTLTPSTTSSVAFTAATLKVVFANNAASSNVTSYRLWYDANGDGYPQSGESSWIGTYSGSTSEGYVTFPAVTGQTITAARKYILTVSISNSATTNGTIVASIPDQSYITATSPAYVIAGGPWTGNTMTVKAPGTATKLVFVGYSSREIATGDAITVTIQQQDAAGTPVNTTVALAVTIAVNQNCAIAGTTTGSISAGSDVVSISNLILTNAAGTSSALINATSTHPNATSSSIKIYPTGPTSNGTLTLGTATATTIPITIATVGDGTNRIIVMRQGQPPAVPVDGVSYSAVTNVANADVVGIGQTGAGSIVVYDGVGGATTNFTVTGLTVNTEYYFAMYEYTGSGSLKNYYTTTAAVVNTTTLEGTPSSYGSNVTAGTAASISTDVDVYGVISNASEAGSGKFYSFIVPSGKNNILIRLSSLPMNYSIELYSTATTPMRLMRSAANLSTTDEVMIINNAVEGRYILKVYGADTDQSSSSYFKLRVNTSDVEYMSQSN